MKQPKIITLKIESLAFEGYGIGRHNDFVYFVRGAVPGDIVEVVEKKRQKKYAFANVQKITEPSQHRIKPVCSYFGECGGCSLQNLDYEEQLFWKTQFVKDSLKKFAAIDPEIVQPALACHQTFEFRNKMEFSFSSQRWLRNEEIQNKLEILNRNFALGLHTPNNYLKVIDIDYCHIQNRYANDILNFVRAKAKEDLIEPYDNKSNAGFLKNLIIRYSVTQDAFLVILVTNHSIDKSDNQFAKDIVFSIKDTFPKVTGAIWAVNSSRSPVAKGEIKHIAGDQYLYEKILGVNYRISPFSFFQTNTYQLKIFINKILEIAELKNNQLVWDLYCGAGSITLPAASLVRNIYGFELVEDAIIDAKFNAENNNIQNAYFYQLDLHSKTIMNELIKFPRPDVVILDPPRSGMHNNLLASIMQISPQEILYVSCNPTTQARDLNILKNEYQTVYCQPIDLFPHTYHIENLIKLIKK